MPNRRSDHVPAPDPRADRAGARADHHAGAHATARRLASARGLASVRGLAGATLLCLVGSLGCAAVYRDAEPPLSDGPPEPRRTAANPHVVVGLPEEGAVANPFPIDDREYRYVYAAAIETLRSRGFRVDRADYRRGTISTRDGATDGAAWRRVGPPPWHVGFLQAAINDQRRRVRLWLDPVVDAADPLAPPDYALRVEAIVWQRHAPDQQLTGSYLQGAMVNVSPRVRGGGRSDRNAEAFELDPDDRWRPLGRDLMLEQQLIHQIIRRATRLAIDPGRSPLTRFDD